MFFLAVVSMGCTHGQIFNALGALQESCRVPVVLTLNNHGLGVDLLPVIGALKRGLITGEPVRVREAPWHYARGVCGSESLRCFFKPVVYDLYCNRRRVENVTLCPHLDDVILKYITQPTAALDRAATTLVGRVGLRLPCLAMHVRRTDTLLNDGWDHLHPRYKWVPLSAYVLKAKQIDVASTLLVTDDAAVITEAALFNRSWVWIDRPRHTGTSGGWENHFPSGDKLAEMAVIVALRQLTSRCIAMVGSDSSFGRLLFLGMRDAVYRRVETRV